MGLNVDGVWYEEPNKVKLKVKEFFENKFGKDNEAALKLDGIYFNHLSQADNTFLKAPLETEEIKEAIRDCDGDRSPEPDNYNFKFKNIHGIWYTWT